MSKKEYKIIHDDVIYPATPEKIAEIFSEMFSDEQARFYNHLGRIASTWSWGDMGMQLQYITDEDGLDLTGRRTMQYIGEYSHWGLVPRAEYEEEE